MARRRGRPAIALLAGEPGIGKTRLADEAARIARDDGMCVLRGESDALSHRPMELWRGVYRALRAVPDGDPSLPAEERRWEYLETLVDALASRAPAIVVLEDLHWADAIAIWVLEHLPRALGDAPVALVALLDQPRPRTGHAGAGRSTAGVPAHPAGRTGRRRGPSALARRSAARFPVDAVDLHARTGGNPLFVMELVRSPDGGAVIGEVLRRSLDRFDPPTREALATAAAGPGTPLSVLAHGCSCTTNALAERLDPALRDGVLAEASPAGVRFRHALLAEAAGRLGDPRARHARLAAAWQTVNDVNGRAAAAEHRLKSALDGDAVAAVQQACAVAAELADGRPAGPCRRPVVGCP